jgi:hypothetical protein
MNWKTLKHGAESWQNKLMEFTHDKERRPKKEYILEVMVFRAAIHHEGGGYPRLADTAMIDVHGMVRVDYIASLHRIFANTVVESDIALRDRFRRLADALKLDDADRTELFACIQQWISIDRRNKSILDRDG